MRVLGMHVERPRTGQWVAAVGLAATLVGTQSEFLVYQWYGVGQDYIYVYTTRNYFIDGEAWAGWFSYAVVATVAISLVAALLGATLVSLSGSMIALGGVVVLPLAILEPAVMFSPESLYYSELGYFIMAAGCALAAYGSSIDVRQRLARDPSPKD